MRLSIETASNWRFIIPLLQNRVIFTSIDPRIYKINRNKLRESIDFVLVVDFLENK
jgi:hypothetical protein